jgi:hypothetical protein
MGSGTFNRMGAALLLSALAACGSIQAAPKAPLADLETSLVQLQGAYSAGEVVNCLAQPLASQDAVVCRDRIVQALMIAVDLRYEEFEIGFFDANRYASFGATLAALGLSTAGAVVSGGTSQILSAAAAGVIGAREGFKREVLVEQTSVALLVAMRAQRDQIGLRIRLGLRQDATEYPLGAALADVSAYYRAGTIVGALTGVTQAVGVEREQAQDNLQRSIVDPEFVPPARFIGAPSGNAPATQPPPPAAGTRPPPPAAGTRPPPPTFPGRDRTSVGPPPPTAEISEAEFLQLRDVFGLTAKNAPLKNRENAPAFRAAVRALHNCKNPSLPEVQQSAKLTPEEKLLALANTDPCLKQVRDSRARQPGAAPSPSPQSSPPGTGAQPGPTSPTSQASPPGAGAQPGPTSPTPQASPPGAGAQPGPSNPEPVPLLPRTR